MLVIREFNPETTHATELNPLNCDLLRYKCGTQITPVNLQQHIVDESGGQIRTLKHSDIVGSYGYCRHSQTQDQNPYDKAENGFK